jgi:integrase/recombinase XerD
VGGGGWVVGWRRGERLRRTAKTTAGMRRGEDVTSRAEWPGGVAGLKTRRGDGMESFENVVEGFQKALRVRNYSGETVRHYGEMLKGFFAYLEGQGVTDIRRVGKPMLKAYQLALREWRSEEDKPYSWATVAGKVQVVKRLFEWLEETGKILVNPAEAMAEVKAGDRLPRNVLTERQMEKMLDGVDLSTEEGVRDRAILEVFYSTGLRLSEMEALTLNDLDMSGGLVRVNAGKGDKDRVVPCGMAALSWVKDYVVKVRGRFTKRTKKATQALWVNHMGGPLSHQLIRLMVRRYGREAGLQVSPHVLRHTFATQLVKNGAPVEVVAKMLGHSDIRTVHKYARVAGVDLRNTQAATHPREKDEMEKAVAQVESIKGRYVHEL